MKTLVETYNQKLQEGVAKLNRDKYFMVMNAFNYQLQCGYSLFDASFCSWQVATNIDDARQAMIQNRIEVNFLLDDHAERIMQSKRTDKLEAH